MTLFHFGRFLFTSPFFCFGFSSFFFFYFFFVFKLLVPQAQKSIREQKEKHKTKTEPVVNYLLLMAKLNSACETHFIIEGVSLESAIRLLEFTTYLGTEVTGLTQRQNPPCHVCVFQI